MADTKMNSVNNPFIEASRTLWIHFTVKELNSQSANGRSKIGATSINEKFKLIAPKELSTNLGHTWGEYESMSSRIAETGEKVSKTMAEAGTVWKGLKAGVSGGAAAGVAALKSTPVRWHRQDTAITYSDSDRREINLSFELAAYKDPKKEVFDIVRKFEVYSCPSMIQSWNNKVVPPYIFSINSVFGENTYVDLLNIENAALVAVSPTYSFPYLYATNISPGYPCKCELTLTFREIDPLYRTNFNYEDQSKKLIVTTDNEDFGR